MKAVMKFARQLRGMGADVEAFVRGAKDAKILSDR